MHPLIWLAAKAFLACLILTPNARDIARIFGFVDKPDPNRKTHPFPIPRVGGIAIAIAYGFAIYFSPGEYSSFIWKLTPAALVVFGTGLIDDFRGLKPWQKLIGQLAAAGLAYWEGVRVFGVVGHAPAAWWGLPLTIAWLILCTNAFNLVDGLDGLAAGMGLVATITISAAALMAGNTPLAYASLPLAGALVGFLCYNLSPATIFLGDSGSLLIGFLLGCYGALWSQKSAVGVGIIVPVLTLSIPLLDVALAVLRRFLRSQPIFTPDRGHIHHRLLDRGLTPRRAVLVLYLVCAIAAAFALLLTLPFGRIGLVVSAICAIALVWGIRELRYSEFGIAGRLFFGGELQRTLGGQLRLERFAARLANCQTDEDCWSTLLSAARDFGFASVNLSFRGNFWSEKFSSLATEQCWSAGVPLGGDDSIELTRPFESGALAAMISGFLDVSRRGLQAKREKWSATYSVVDFQGSTDSAP